MLLGGRSWWSYSPCLDVALVLLAASPAFVVLVALDDDQAQYGDDMGIVYAGFGVPAAFAAPLAAMVVRALAVEQPWSASVAQQHSATTVVKGRAAISAMIVLLFLFSAASFTGLGVPYLAEAECLEHGSEMNHCVVDDVARVYKIERPDGRAPDGGITRVSVASYAVSAQGNSTGSTCSGFMLMRRDLLHPGIATACCVPQGLCGDVNVTAVPQTIVGDDETLRLHLGSVLGIPRVQPALQSIGFIIFLVGVIVCHFAMFYQRRYAVFGTKYLGFASGVDAATIDWSDDVWLSNETCVAAASLVRLATGTLVRADAIRPGDVVWTLTGPAHVQAVVWQEKTAPLLFALPGGLMISKPHRVMHDGAWMKPESVPGARIVRCGRTRLCNMIVSNRGVVNINGTLAATIGGYCPGAHDLDRLNHLLWASERVVAVFQLHPAWPHIQLCDDDVFLRLLKPPCVLPTCMLAGAWLAGRRFLHAAMPRGNRAHKCSR